MSCSIVENDEFFKQYLLDDYKNNVTTPLLSVSEQIKKLSEGIQNISIQLNDQINLKHEDLLSRASSSSTLESELSNIQTHVQSLHCTAEKIKQSIDIPCKILENEINLLSRLHSVCHILRHVCLMLRLSKDLKNASSSISTQAKIISDLNDLVKDPTMKGLEIVVSTERHIRTVHRQIFSQAEAEFKLALSDENKLKISTNVQILKNLNSLEPIVDDFIKSVTKDITESIKNILHNENTEKNINAGKSGPGSITKSNQSSSKEKLLSSLEIFFQDKLYTYCKQVKLLANILQDNNEISEKYSTLAKDFWNAVSDIISTEMKSSSIYQCILEEDYPRLLRLYSDILKKLDSKHFVSRHSLVVSWENIYLSKSLSRLLEPVNEMFIESNNLPSQETIDAFTRIISRDLSVALVEDSLSDAIAKNVAKCLRSFALKVENVIINTPETKAAQQFNVQAANTVHYLINHIQRMLLNMNNTLPKTTNSIIKDSIDILEQVIVTIIAPLVETINFAIETIINTIHLESDWNRLQLKKGSTSCSPYMRELTTYIDRAYNMHLSPFNSSEALNTSCSNIAKRCIDLFVRHTSLVRPITEGGRLRLQNDYRELENALTVLCPQLQTLGQPYRLFKSMATVIVLPPSEIVKSQQVGSSVPHSIVLFLLFSHCDAMVQSPHETAGWTLQKLSAWLDEHTNEKDRLELISGALQNYVTKVRKNNVTNFDPTYVLMTNFLNKDLNIM